MRHSNRSPLIALIFWAMMLAQSAGLVHRFAHMDPASTAAVQSHGGHQTQDHGLAHPCALLDLIGSSVVGTAFAESSPRLHATLGKHPTLLRWAANPPAYTAWSKQSARAPPQV